mmetsp:Transcript_45597/g.83788  ORF Transcript_45597/g.83788 Transcript_45597/m.83788 type:complete len:233 (+) Transcript_45597:1464-2162(+)
MPPRLSGNKWRPRVNRYSKANKLTGPPTFAGSKKPKDSFSPSPLFSIIPIITKFVDVPIIVIKPPPMVEKDSGMRNLEGAKFRPRAQSRRIGISSATSGVLLKNPEKARPRLQSRSRAPNSVVFLPKHFLATLSTTLALSTPSTTMNSAPTVIRDELLKPKMASLVSMIPKFQTTANAPSNTISGGLNSLYSSTKAISITTRTAHPSHCINLEAVPKAQPQLGSTGLHHSML